MKRFLNDVAVGAVLFLMILLAEFLVTLPLGIPEGLAADDAARRSALLVEFGLTAPLALVLSFLLARARRTTDPLDGLRRGLVWLLVVGAFYVVLALGNSNQLMFGVPTLYLLVAAVVLGPVLAGWWAARRASGQVAAPRATT